MDTIYERIKQLRIEKGLSQRELALKLGYNDRSTISKIEAGLVDIGQSKIKEIAEVLETTPAYLLGETAADAQAAADQATVLDGVDGITLEIMKKVKNMTTEELLELRGYISGKFGK